MRLFSSLFFEVIWFKNIRIHDFMIDMCWIYKQNLCFGFDDNRNLCIHAGVCVYVWVCMCVCVYVCVSWRLLVNTISQEGKLGQISYLVCRCTTLSTRTLLFLVEVKGHLRSTGVKLWKHCKNLVNTISQEGKLGQISYLVCKSATLRTRSLLFLVEVKAHLRSTGVKLWKHCKNLVNTISQDGSLDRSHMWYVGASHWVQEAYCFWWRSKVIWGQQGSKCETL